MMDMNTIKNGISLKLAQDYSYNPNPREDDNLGEMVCFHSTAPCCFFLL